jgi:hypothetical protein
MKTKLIEHISGIIFVSLMLFATLIGVTISKGNRGKIQDARIKDFVNAPITNINDPFQRALLKDVMNVFYPDQAEKNDAVTEELLVSKEKQINSKLSKGHLEEHLSFKKMMQLSGMYIKFLIVYSIVMILTWYGVQTLAVWRFVSKKHAISLQFYSKTNDHSIKTMLSKAASIAAKGVAYFLLFSPAYVVAYSIRTEFNTDSTFFMILLGVTSNGLLVMYSNKFYAFLTAEGRKGYIDTALVKNLNCSYEINKADGISRKSIFSFRKNFKGHIFDPIFKNARHQYLSTIKEQASFLITGLVIIEMALNIHGHLNYEMLRQLLYKNYDVVIIIILGIFYTVKATEIITDILVHKESMKYENK